MQVQRFQGTTMQGVLQLIKKELGPDAVILSTRQIRKGKNKYNFFGSPVIEVTAALNEESQSCKVAHHTSMSQGPESKTTSVYTEACDIMQVIDPLHKNMCDMKDLLRILTENQQTLFPYNQVALEDNFKAVKQMIEHLVKENRSINTLPFTSPLAMYYRRLRSSGIEKEFALSLIDYVYNVIDKDKLTQAHFVESYLASTLIDLIQVSGPIRLKPGQTTIATLVGPTGVGKTTTIAKLAAHYTLVERKRVALITIDTYRIAAVEQLNTFAKIIGLPLVVVLSEEELDEALTQYQGNDLILIDTAGRSQRDQLQIAELASYFGRTKRSDLHLVLSATSSVSNLHETVKRFAPLGLDSLIFTKLDESNTFGCILSTAIQAQLPLSYLTTGQQVPEDIEVALPERVVDLILNISQECELKTG